MLQFSIGILGLVLLGHGALWIGVVNRVHATGLSRKKVKLTSLVCYALMFSIGAGIVKWSIDRDGRLLAAIDSELDLAASIYSTVCAGLGVMQIGAWLLHRRPRRPNPVRSQVARTVDMAKVLGHAPLFGLRTQVLSRLPTNQLLRLEVNEKVLALAGWPRALDGMAVVHLSDLHFSGRIGPAYFHEVMRLIDAWKPDLIALTGDICDHAEYIEWIPDTLGRLESPCGKVYILGNHDRRVGNVAPLRAAMADAGFVDLGGRWNELQVHGQGLMIAGNELPWFGPAPDLRLVPANSSAGKPRILLAHTPDQFRWARTHGFGLMLAGHTHGGQICFPVIGPVICPSLVGVRYASGVFEQSPTVMHVSRGVSSLAPVRFNCPPELTKLILVRAEQASSGG